MSPSPTAELTRPVKRARSWQKLPFDGLDGDGVLRDRWLA
jgi:hypothetical protein